MDLAPAVEAATRCKQAGNRHFGARQYSEALDQYRRAIDALEGQAPSATKNELMIACLSNMAQCHLNLGNADDAARAAIDALYLLSSHVKSVLRFCEATSRGASPPESAVLHCLQSLQMLTGTNSLSAADQKLLHGRLVELSMYKVERYGAVSGAKDISALRPAISASQVPRHFRERYCFQHSHDGVDANLLILLHGLGDSPANFIKFGNKLQLPQTALLALGAPHDVPMLGGGMWHETYDADFALVSPNSLHIRRNSQAAAVVASVVEQIQGIQTLPGWSDCRIHLLGFGDGATIAMYSTFACLTGRSTLQSALCIGGQRLKGLPFAEPSTHAGAFTSVDFPESREDCSDARPSLQSYSDSFDSFLQLDWEGHCRLPRNAAETRQVMEHFNKTLVLRLTAFEEDPSVIRVK